MRPAIGGPVAAPVGRFGASAGGLFLPSRELIVGLWEKNSQGLLEDSIGESTILYQTGDASTWGTTAVWGFEYNATMAEIDTLMGGNVLFVGVTPRYFTWAEWMDHAAINDKYLFLGIKGMAGYNVDQSANRTRIRRYLNSVDQALLISDIITSALSDTVGTHTGQLWVPDKDGIYRLTTAANPNIQGGAWDAVTSKLIAPTTYPTRGIRTQKGTRYPTTDTAFRGLTCAPAMTNKVTCRKANPTGFNNFTGDVAYGSVVNDPTAIATAKLQDVCTLGNHYRINNTSGGTIFVQAQGAIGNTNQHTIGLFYKTANNNLIRVRMAGTDAEGSLLLPVAANLTKTSVLCTPSVGTRAVEFRIPAGCSIDFICLELLESSCACTLNIPPTAAADGLASYTRPAIYATYSTTDLLPMTDANNGQNFAIAMRVVPLGTGQSSAWIISSYTDANNYTGILTTATQVILRKRVAGVDTDVTLTYTHAANTPFWVAAILTDQGMAAKARQDGGAWSAWVDVETAAGKAAPPIAATYQIGALNNTSGFAANHPIGPQFIHLGSLAALVDYKTVAEAKLAEILI